MTSVERSREAATGALPFFVYGTLRPGEVNHGLFLRGRTASEESAVLPDAALYDGPGYPYAVHRPGTAVVGELITAEPGRYREVLAELDRLEEYEGPGRPGNVYDRFARRALLSDGTAVRAWVYLASPLIARELLARGTEIPGGDWFDRSATRSGHGPDTGRDRP
ncbi:MULTISPECIES: gamma-glutamylcyclotransferase family protein [unclassified Streptomyces]|uniref:gamma-glutamylcyclotransferase family protein n=1 Tax=unclassified Streptomyces TaxID=2593676 RepID=UPI00044E8B17|nr:gamma-glutamylcyclotransferase family protein [Streptomyces sp. PCS3-D2]WKV74042.1 gamma-glutamylcyclotransferase [Streptomyces sp. PCS3-D2]